VGFGAYHFNRGAFLDFALVNTNFAEIFKPGALFFFAHTLGWLGFMAILSLIAIIYFIERKKIHIEHFSQRRMLSILLISFSLNAGFLVLFDQDANELNAFARSIWRHYHSPFQDEALKDFQVGYPYMQEGPRPAVSSLKRKPSIFIIFVESLNSTLLNQKTPAGQNLTPFLNARMKDSFFIENFFANSMQTAKGQVATLCSIVPSFRHKIMTHYLDHQMRCLPEILKELGYHNVFAKAHTDISFDRSEEFAKRVGYDEVYAMEAENLDAEDYSKIWGWGLEDDVFFDKVLKRLDIRNQKDPSQPFFATLTTVSNHAMFDRVPPEIPVPYPQAKNYREHYANTVHLSDQYLEHFWTELKKRDYLKDSLVFILGDHGYATGEKGHYSNEIGFQDSIFRVPLLVLGLPKQSISKTAYSQLDLAPTILNLLRAKSAHHFFGEVIGGEKAAQHFIPIVQPYDGRFLGSIRYPLKFIHHWSSGLEYLFDLSEDPLETKNIVAEASPQLLAEFREDIRKIYGNQLLVESDRLFPKLLDLKSSHLKFPAQASEHSE